MFYNNQHTETMDNKEKVKMAFIEARVPLKAGEVADLSKIDKKDVDKIIKEMIKDGELVSPKRCYYELK